MGADPARLLVVETGPRDAEEIRRALAVAGYDVTLTADEDEALRIVGGGAQDAVIVDAPAEETKLVSRLREEQRDVPLLVVSSSDSARERVAGLDAGADDYLVRPFAVEDQLEFLARVRALLRRGAGDEVLEFSDLTLDPETRSVERAGRAIDLTPIEFGLLELLLRNAGRVVPRPEILRRVWGFDFGATSNSLNVYVGYVRRKTEAAGEPRLIHTVRGVGYVLREA